jgi:hypothetical protein
VARPSRRRFAPPQDEDEGVDGRFCCKQQRIYKAHVLDCTPVVRHETRDRLH